MHLFNLDKVAEGLSHFKKGRVECYQHKCGSRCHGISKWPIMVKGRDKI